MSPVALQPPMDVDIEVEHRPNRGTLGECLWCAPGVSVWGGDHWPEDSHQTDIERQVCGSCRRDWIEASEERIEFWFGGASAFVLIEEGVA
jgi:hypothetical protein